MTEEPEELLVGPPPRVEQELSPVLRPSFHCHRESRSFSFFSLRPVVVMRQPVIWLLLLGWVPTVPHLLEESSKFLARHGPLPPRCVWLQLLFLWR